MPSIDWSIRLEELKTREILAMATNSAVVVDVVVDGGQLRIARLADARWQVGYRGVEATGRRLVVLLEEALGRRHPDVPRLAVQAMEANPPRRAIDAEP